MHLIFIPQPQKVQKNTGWFNLPKAGVIGIPDHSLYSMALQMRRSFAGYAIQISRKGLSDTIGLYCNSRLRPDEYYLTILSSGIRLEGASATALFYGIQTLRQIVKQSPVGKLPSLTIHDWPDFPERGVYYDVARGRVPKLERLKQMADVLSEYKINQLQLYIEHTFAFRGHPDIGKGASPLTAEDILELDAWCRERRIELVPSLASFGHLSTVLQHPRYRHLAEDWGKGKYITPDRKIQDRLKDWLKQGQSYAFTLSPANPAVYVFLDSLLAEYLPLFSSRKFNACCDETFDLGYGQSYKLCQKIGRGRLYLNHIVKLNELSHKYGKQLMFWGDIIRNYPELIAELPKDAIVLDWGYQYNHPFEKIRDFKKAGLDFYCCPSVSGYCSLFPRLPQAAANIAGFAAAGYMHGARGLLNTDWGDGGHYNFMEYSWPGFLYGAERSWNAKSNQHDFTQRFCRLFMNIAGPGFSEALDELGRISHLQASNFYQSVWQHIFFSGTHRPLWDAQPQKASIADRKGIHEGKVALNARLGSKISKRLAEIRKVFCGYLGQKGSDPLKILPYWIFAIDSLRHAARKLCVYAPDGNRAADNRKSLRKELRSLRSRFVNLWMARNRRSEIKITLRKYRRARRAELTFQIKD